MSGPMQNTPPGGGAIPGVAWASDDIHSSLKKNSAMGSDQEPCEFFEPTNKDVRSYRERDDNYHDVVAQLDPRWRVIVCKDYLQWIIQKRTAEPLHRGVWRSQSYITSRSSLIRLCASLELLSDPLARARLEALPEQFSGLYKK